MSSSLRIRAALPLALAVLTLAVILVGGVAGDSDPALSDEEWVFTLELDSDGDGHWQLTQELNVTTAEEELAFQELATAFEDGTYELNTVGTFERAVVEVDDLTPRQMRLDDHDRTATLDAENNTGTLSASFTWENFARTSEERLVIDDVLETTDGIWFDGLSSEMELRVIPPENYAVFDATQPPRNGELRWVGPQEFDAQTLVAEFRGTGNNQNGENNQTDDPDENGDAVGTFLVGGIVLVALLAVAVVMVWYRDGKFALIQEDADDDDGEEPAASEPEADESASPATPVASPADDEIDEELLSDEERVERLLEANGGRMKQAQIVNETDWSNAKVSQLLSKMEDDGDINKLRIGRENLISFPDVDLTDSDDS